MKRLYLLRHAHAQPKNYQGTDFDRPLDEKGKAQAQKMNQYFQSQNIFPDQILCSSSQRTRQTRDLLLDNHIPTLYSDQLYLNHHTPILNLINQQNESIQNLLVVGHGPDLQNLCLYLCHDITSLPFLPTCGLYMIEISSSWKDIDKRSQSFIGLIPAQTNKG